jgi:hypothetical protein
MNWQMPDSQRYICGAYLEKMDLYFVSDRYFRLMAIMQHRPSNYLGLAGVCGVYGPRWRLPPATPLDPEGIHAPGKCERGGGLQFVTLAPSMP